MPTLSQKLKNVKMPVTPQRPVWKGPSEDGVTQSLLSRFLVCRERFRLRVVEGLRPSDRYENRMEFGNLFCACSEALGKGNNFEGPLKAKAQELMTRYINPSDREAIDKAYNIIRVQFPIYVEHWEKHPDVKQRTPLLHEVPFSIPYLLPSGRTLLLRGKLDGLDLIGPKTKAEIFIQEDKTKSDIDEVQLRRQLNFDLQTMFYHVAMEEALNPRTDWKLPEELLPIAGLLGKTVAGTRYNCVRRPLAGGKHSIRPHQATTKKPAETMTDFYARLAGLIREDAEYFFLRLKVNVNRADVKRYKEDFLDPVGETLCDWWELMKLTDYQKPSPPGPAGKGPSGYIERLLYGLHYRLPYGVYNVLLEGGSSDLDEYLATGSELGLVRSDDLFPELT